MALTKLAILISGRGSNMMSIVSACEGHFGSEEVPARLADRVSPGELFHWPLMAILWAFDVDKVAERSLMAEWIRDEPSVLHCVEAVAKGRHDLGDAVRDVEDLPRHQEMRSGFNRWQKR